MSPPIASGYHRLEVKVRNPDLQVNARSGYYEEAERKPAPSRGSWTRQGKGLSSPEVIDGARMDKSKVKTKPPSRPLKRSSISGT